MQCISQSIELLLLDRLSARKMARRYWHRFYKCSKVQFILMLQHGPIKRSCIFILHLQFTFSHLADGFIQSDLQMKTMEAIKINKRAMIYMCYNNKSQLA